MGLMTALRARGALEAAQAMVEFFRADSLMPGPFRAAQVVSLLVILGVGLLFWRHPL